MKKTLTCLILYLLISPIVADIIKLYLGSMAKGALVIIFIVSYISCFFAIVALVFNSFCKENMKIRPDNLDERIFGGKK